MIFSPNLFIRFLNTIYCVHTLDITTKYGIIVKHRIYIYTIYCALLLILHTIYCGLNKITINKSG